MKSLLAGLLFLTMVSAANAASYNFSYTFASDGTLVTGSFDGTQSGDLVEGLSNITVSFNGASFTGPLFASCVDYATLNFATDCGVASFSGTANNLFFIDVNYPTVLTGFTNYFHDYTPYTGVKYVQVSPSSIVAHTELVDTTLHNSRWTLTAVGVPETSSLFLLTFGLIGIFGAARRKV